MTLDFPLRTERLDLRPFTPGDLDDAYAYRSLPEVTAYLYWGAQTREEVRDRLAEQAAQTVLEKDGDVLKLAVEWREKAVVVGEVTLVRDSGEQRSGEIGFVFNPAHQGLGLAGEAARELLRVAFEEFGMHRVIGRCDAANTPSVRLMERLGMRREAHFVDNEIMPYSKDRENPWTSEYVYAMLDREWRA